MEENELLRSMLIFWDVPVCLNLTLNSELELWCHSVMICAAVTHTRTFRTLLHSNWLTCVRNYGCGTLLPVPRGLSFLDSCPVTVSVVDVYCIWRMNFPHLINNIEPILPAGHVIGLRMGVSSKTPLTHEDFQNIVLPQVYSCTQLIHYAY